jgi:hypothetical protein
MLTLIAHAWQSWRYARSVFVLASAALAVGIGATTAIYTVVNAVMLRPLAYPHGERLGQLFGATIGQPDGVAAALIMSVVQASLRIISSDPNLSLPDLAARMNQFLYRSTQSNSYATFFYARIDERSLRINM